MVLLWCTHFFPVSAGLLMVTCAITMIIPVMGALSAAATNSVTVFIVYRSAFCADVLTVITDMIAVLIGIAALVNTCLIVQTFAAVRSSRCTCAGFIGYAYRMTLLV